MKEDMHKRGYHILSGWLLLSIFILSGCISEDDCPKSLEAEVTFNFCYDYNLQYIDRFEEEVDHISIFIYDVATENLQKRIDMFCNDMEAKQTVTTTLPVGEYIAVAWGNCDHEADYFAITQTEKLSTLQMGLTCIDENNEATVNKIGSVFHSMNSFEAIGGEIIPVPMSMVKNTNRVRVIIRGMDQMSKEEAEERMKIRITSNNWKYDYSNTRATKQFIEYRSEYTSGEEIIADFYILRMQADYEDDIIINLQHREPGDDRTPNVVLERSLIPLLINLPTPLPAMESASRNDDTITRTNELLDRQDEYEVIFDVAIDANGQLYIEDWEHINKPGEF